MSGPSTPGTERESEEVVCPNTECNIDQRWDRIAVLCCPECGARLVPACEECNSGAVERIGGSPLCSDHVGMARSPVRVYDLYSGPGGVGKALDELEIPSIGVDVVDHGATYPGEFVQADANEPPLEPGADLVWASPPCTAYSDLSPTHYGSREAALEACPTIPELRVREVADRLGAEYVIENVPGATREGHLRDPTRINGLAFGKPYDLERHFETSFPVPDAYEPGEPEVVVDTRGDQSVRQLAEAKGVPPEWGKQGVRSAIPREYVRWLLGHCPTLDVEPPRRPQATLTGVTSA